MDSEQSEIQRREALKETEKKGLEMLAEMGLVIEGEKVDLPTVALLKGTREEAEAAERTGKNVFGTMPHFDSRQEVLAHVPDAVRFFEQAVDIARLPQWKRNMYTSGMVAYELKFGKPLSSLVKDVLKNYPVRKDSQGRKISLCGLSGSGKSTAVESIREVLGDAVVIDSDTTRYNLFAKDVQTCEEQSGASHEEVQQRIHNSAISGAMYLSLEFVTNVLRQRGYDVVMVGTSPAEGSDKSIYIEHRLMDPRTIGQSGDKEKDDTEIAAAAHELAQITEARVASADSYDWDHAEQITKFDEMKDVTVRVPEFVHGIFIRNLQRDLMANRSIVPIVNPETNDPVVRKAKFTEQLRNVLIKNR